jgi:hypothetical protein
MQLPILYAMVVLLALMALFDIVSTAAVLAVDPLHYTEGVGWIAATMRRIGVLPALLLWRLPFIAWALTFCFQHAAAKVLPLWYVVAVADTPDYAFLLAIALYGWVVWHNGKALLRALSGALEGVR